MTETEKKETKMKNDMFGVDVMKVLGEVLADTRPTISQEEANRRIQSIINHKETDEKEFVDSVIRGMRCKTSVPHDTVMKNIRERFETPQGIQIGKHYCVGASKVTRDRSYINEILFIVDVVGPKAFVEVLSKYNNKPVRKIFEISEYDWTCVERMKDFYVDMSA